MVWISEVSLRRKPSLSASKIATSAHSGMSRPSRSRLMPTSASKAPSRRSRMISMRSMVSISECIYRERCLAPEIAAEHGADLRNGDVALVGKHQRIVRDIFEQRRRRLAGPAAGEIARIVLDAGAASRGLQHFQIEGGALLQPLRF